MTDTYTGSGDTMDYVNGVTARTAGEPVVINDQLGVCVNAIAASTTGPVFISGVHTLPKVSAAVIAQGESVNWDDSADAVEDEAHTAATGDLEDFGVAMEAAGNGVTTVRVKINHYTKGKT